MQATFQTSSTIVKREDKDAAHNSDKKSKNPSSQKDKKSAEKSPAKLSKHRSGKDQQRRRQSENPSSSDPDSSDDSSSIEDSSSSSDWERGLEEELAPATASTSAASIAYRSHMASKGEATVSAWPSTGTTAEFCRIKGSPYDRYYELKPKKTESARSFLYRLNAAAKRADVDYEGSLSAQELHVRRFLKKLKDNDLRSTLQGQTFKSVRDLEKTLKRVEAVQQDDGYTTQPPKARDSKASDVRFNRFPPHRRDQGNQVRRGRLRC
ncbi:hypothetical protein PI126_g10056 [Phytophthora idaei]|nr:hypothetical protein PI126_g10056 [Phytophthora idaei]